MVKDLGKTLFLRIDLEYNSKGLFLSQSMLGFAKAN